LTRIAAGKVSVDTGTAGNSAGTLIAANVGIGTTSPSSLLAISQNSSAETKFIIENSDPSAAAGGTITFAGDYSGGWSRGKIESDPESGNGGDLALSTANTSGTLVSRLYIDQSGYIAIGNNSFSPYSALQVTGPDAASSTSAFAVVNSASSTVFAVFDGGNAQLSGTLTQSSDQRLKTNITSLDASSTLSLIDQLDPVTFNWIDPNQGNGTQVGFIAQQVQQLFPELVSTTSPTALTPNGTLGLNYIGLISPIVSALQELSADITSIETTLTNFAQSFTSQTITASQDLCVDNSAGTPICVTGDQLAALLANANGASGNNGTTGTQSPTTAQQSQSPATDTPESVTQNSSDFASSTADTASPNNAGSDQATSSLQIVDAPSIVPTQDASTTATSTAQ